jgi:hypothetical protein
MHYSSQFDKPPQKHKPDWLFSFITLTVILYLLISQWSGVRAYYETWIQSLPKQQVLEGVSQKKIELERPSISDQAVGQESTGGEPALLPSYSDQELVAQASENPSPSPTPSNITQPEKSTQPGKPTALVPDRLVIPAIKVDAAVISISPERVNSNAVGSQLAWPVPPADKAGWHSTSAKFGERGNTVINGHNYPQTAVFRSLYKLQPGDEVLLYSKEHLIEYTVIEILILGHLPPLCQSGEPLDCHCNAC